MVPNMQIQPLGIFHIFDIQYNFFTIKTLNEVYCGGGHVEAKCTGYEVVIRSFSLRKYIAFLFKMY